MSEDGVKEKLLIKFLLCLSVSLLKSTALYTSTNVLLVVESSC